MPCGLDQISASANPAVQWTMSSRACVKECNVGASSGWTSSSGPRSHGSLLSEASLCSAAMRVYVGNAQTIEGIAFEVEFDRHGRLIAHHPAFVFGLHLNELGRFVFHNAPVGETDIDLTVRHETDMRVHAVLAAHQFT